MHIHFPFEREAAYLVACSYGPDSMALLHLLGKQHRKLVVCHVNYHKRDVSDFEEESLRKYCHDHGYIFEKMDADSDADHGNFQAWAREMRYDFFADMYREYDAKALFVAHQQDDLIETYLIQKQRKSRVKRYGIEQISQMKGMVVVRPLLEFSKQDLLDYCHENLVPYSIDISNSFPVYLRNRIRHGIVANLTEIEKGMIIEEIKEANMRLDEISKVAEQQVKAKPELDIATLVSLSEPEFNETIIRFVAQAEKHVALSNEQLREIRNICQSDNPNIDIPLALGLSLLKEYDVLVLGDKLESEPYSFVMDKPGALATAFFELDFTDGAEDRNIHLDDYPLTIRTFLPKDRYAVGDNLCEVRRLFIDWKMPSRLRTSWPIIVSKNGTIIYVPRYRKNFVETKKSKFVIKVV